MYEHSLSNTSVNTHSFIGLNSCGSQTLGMDPR